VSKLCHAVSLTFVSDCGIQHALLLLTYPFTRLLTCFCAVVGPRESHVSIGNRLSNIHISFLHRGIITMHPVSK